MTFSQSAVRGTSSCRASQNTHRSSTTPHVLLNQKCHICAHLERNLGKLFIYST